MTEAAVPRAPAEPLTDGRITVRPPSPTDLGAIDLHRDDPDAGAWLSARSAPFDPAALLDEYLAGWRGEPNRLGMTLVVEDAAAGGFAGLVHLDHAGGTEPGTAIALAYGVAPAARRRGVATTACRLVTAWALANGYERVEVEVALDNEPSRRVAEACGFREERRVRVAIPATGEVHEAAVLVRRAGLMPRSDRPAPG